MKIKYEGSIKCCKVSDLFNAGFLRKPFEADEYDYLMYITLFGREWSWYIDK